jgi:hypothetical protein
MRVRDLSHLLWLRVGRRVVGQAAGANGVLLQKGAAAENTHEGGLPDGIAVRCSCCILAKA